MSLQNFSYFLILGITALIYWRLPQKLQTPFLALSSIYFYAQNLYASYNISIKNGSSNTEALFLLLVSVGLLLFVLIFVWRMGIFLSVIGEKNKKRTLTVAVITLLVVLAIFKYYNLSPLPTIFAGSLLEKLPFPLGISFFTFAAIGYLVDVARKDCEAEKKLCHVAVFLFFFATVTSGPICRGGALLPQLHKEQRFDTLQTTNALRLFALGLFKKVALADVLAMTVNVVFDDTANFGAPMLLLALLLYTFQLYFDFSGYSDLARASGLLLGLEIPENFKTPFFATNFSGFWSRWHISLSSWLQDYVFMPIAWADVSKIPLIGKFLAKKWEHFPVEFCVFSVFFISGFWHGNTAPFIIWGLLQAIFRVGEELMHRHIGRPKRKGVKARVLWSKRLGVFCLWAFSMVFFRIGSSITDNTLADCAKFFTGLTANWGLSNFWQELNLAIATGFYQNDLLQLAYIALVIIVLTLGIYLDARRNFSCKNKASETALASETKLKKWLIYYMLVMLIFIGFILQNGGFGGVSFSYAQY